MIRAGRLVSLSEEELRGNAPFNSSVSALFIGFVLMTDFVFSSDYLLRR